VAVFKCERFEELIEPGAVLWVLPSEIINGLFDSLSWCQRYAVCHTSILKHATGDSLEAFAGYYNIKGVMLG
jgi:hypothetical protein